MSERILLVDDEPNLLHSLRRSLRGKYTLSLAVGGHEAVAMIESAPDPFAVIISDMQMPEIDGLKVLHFARETTPDSVRIMLTGNVDQQTAVNAINSGAIYRFLNKPCPPDTLGVAINDALKQYRLVVSERELLSQTVRGAVSLITDMLALANPDLANRGSQTSHLARRLAKSLNWEDPWQYEVAAMLAQIGRIGETDTQHTPSAEANLAVVSSRLVQQIPRLEPVAEIIRSQFDENLVDREVSTTRQGAILLRMLSEFDSLRDHHSVTGALDILNESKICEPEIHACLRTILLDEMSPVSVNVEALEIGMILENDLLTTDDVMLLRKGTELNALLLERIADIQKNSCRIQEPVEVRIMDADGHSKPRETRDLSKATS